MELDDSDDESLNALENAEPSRIVRLSDFLCGRLLGNADPKVGLTRSLISAISVFYGGSIIPVLTSLRRDGHLPWDVTEEALENEFASFALAPMTPQIGSKPTPHDSHTTLTGVGLVPGGTQPPLMQSTSMQSTHVNVQPGSKPTP